MPEEKKCKKLKIIVIAPKMNELYNYLSLYLHQMCRNVTFRTGVTQILKPQTVQIDEANNL